MLVVFLGAEFTTYKNVQVIINLRSGDSYADNQVQLAVIARLRR